MSFLILSICYDVLSYISLPLVPMMHHISSKLCKHYCTEFLMPK